MGRGRKRRQRGAGRHGRRFTVDVRVLDLEVAKGHDGLLRGPPDPAICLGLFAVHERRATPLGRAVVRVRLTTKTGPERASVDGEPPVRTKFTFPTGSSVVVVMVALEEDSGHAVRDVFAALGDVEDLCLWRPDRDVMPLHVNTLDDVVAPAGAAVGVDVAHTADGRGAFVGDKWVGAGVVRLPVQDGRFERTVRFAVTAPDGKNEWTVGVGVRWR